MMNLINTYDSIAKYIKLSTDEVVKRLKELQRDLIHLRNMSWLQQIFQCLQKNHFNKNDVDLNSLINMDEEKLL